MYTYASGNTVVGIHIYIYIRLEEGIELYGVAAGLHAKGGPFMHVPADIPHKAMAATSHITTLHSYGISNELW